jgi:hypothetical protein
MDQSDLSVMEGLQQRFTALRASQLGIPNDTGYRS